MNLTNLQNPFAVIRIHQDSSSQDPSTLARSLITRSILAKGIYSLWGSGQTYPDLHSSIKSRSSHQWLKFRTCSFRLSIDSYCGKRASAEQRDVIESFSYLGFEGPIRMKGADESFDIFEDYGTRKTPATGEPLRLFFGREIALSSRDVVKKYDLKKRSYISTTSMDAELSLVGANLALAAPGKMFYDPFIGTGGLLVAAMHYGAMAWGSDIDGRAFRGNKRAGSDQNNIQEKSLWSNLKQYDLDSRFGDALITDLTNSPVMRRGRSGDGRSWLDGIVCDPPYGVREGLKVLGLKDGKDGEVVHRNGVPAHT